MTHCVHCDQRIDWPNEPIFGYFAGENLETFVGRAHVRCVSFVSCHETANYLFTTGRQ